MKTAALAAWQRSHQGLPTSRGGSSGMGGAAFLTTATNPGWFATQFPNARLIVEWAPTAPIATYGDDSRGWAWEDITGDVLYNDNSAITISPMGRSDAVSSTQPSGCSFTVDNRLGKYSKGPQNSIYYPNVKMNVPVRVSISLDGTPQNRVTRFQGYIWSFKPSWDHTANFAVVAVTAAGTSRRLQQRSVPLRSPIYRSVLKSVHGKAYWPMEDSVGSTFLASGLDGGAPMRISNMTLASYSGIPGSLDIPVFTATSTYQAPIVMAFPDSDSGSTISFFMNVPAATAADTAIMRVHMQGSSSIVRWEIVIPSATTTTVGIKGYDASGAIVVNNAHSAFTVVGVGPVQYIFSIHQSGANTEYSLVRGGVTFSGSLVATATTAGTCGVPNQITMLANAQNVGISIGHIAIYNNYVQSVPILPAQGWVADGGDSAASRILRLAAEENSPVSFNGSEVPTWYDDSAISNGSYTWVGYQSEEAFLNLVQTAAEADLGLLGDGLGPGLFFRTRSSMENQTVKMTLSVTNDELMPPFQPEDDDQQILNSVTVTRTNGATTSFTQTSGNVGTAAIDVYDGSQTVLVRYDEQLDDIAGWLVKLGTVEGYRYPTLTIGLHKIPQHAAEWLSVIPGDYIKVTGASTYASQHPTGDIDLLVEGWQEVLSQFTWDVQLNCSPQTPWGVGVLDATPETAYPQRLDTDGTYVVVAASVGATSLSTLALSGPRWTTDTADMPLYINLRGYRVQVTAISGATTSQTFTTEPLPIPILVGQVYPITLWNPNTLGI